MDKKRMQRYLHGTATAEERAAFIRWIERKPEHRKEYAVLRRLYDACLCGNLPAEVPERASRPRGSRRFGRVVWGASLAMLCVGMGWSFSSLRQAEARKGYAVTRCIEVPVGQRVKLTLADGSTVWLNSNSRLTFPSKFSSTRREVTLEGEAFLQVAHCAERPFTVHAGGYDIRVLGTTFHVSNYRAEAFEVSLLEGAVRVKEKATGQCMRLAAREKAVACAEGLRKERLASEETFDWMEGYYEFHNADYATVFRKLEEYYDVRIVVHTDSVLHYKCTGKFRQRNGIEHILNVLRHNHSFRYRWCENDSVLEIR